MIYKSYIIVFLSLFLIGCFEGSSKTKTSSPSNKVANLYDSALGNVDYFICNNSNDKKQTLSDGKFYYDSSCDVDFYIGDKIHLGQISGAKIDTLSAIKNNKLVYITHILGLDTYDTTDQKVKNLAKFLVSLDSDANPDNGIDINNSTKSALNQASINALDFTNDIDEDTLNNTLLSVVDASKIVSEAYAVSHLEKSLREVLGGSNVDNQGPPTPYLIDKYTSLSTDLTAIRTKHTKIKTVRLKGEIGTSIMMAFNYDGNMSNLDFNTTSYKINDDGYCDIPLVFDNDEETYFHYYFKLVDDANNTSNILHLNVTKDHIPPFVKDSYVKIATPEEQTFLSNIFSFDESDVQFYKIIDADEDSFSANHALFSIDENGSVNFNAAPDFEQFPNAVYYVVARARDVAGNITDVYFQISLYNVLDNPPTLTNTNYTTSILEGLPNGSFIYDLNSTLETNLTIAPDNDPTLSPVYYKIHNHSDIIDINETTGKLTIKDSFNDLFDREKLPNSIDINFSVENNNTHPSNDINITYGTLTLTIDNKIDTTPVLIDGGYTISLDEKKDENNTIQIFNEDIIDYTHSDVNPTMYFSISAIYPDINNSFQIDDHNVTNTIYRLAGHEIEYETQNQYILTVRATNTWYDSSTHYDEVNVTVNINDVVDEPPVIHLASHEDNITEATAIGTVIADVDLNATGFVDDVIDGYRLKVSRYPLAAQQSYELVHPFDINVSTGEVYISKSLNDFYEEKNIIAGNPSDTNDTRYKIDIVAYHTIFDGTEQTAIVVPEFDINITNVTDNPPLIVSSQLTDNLDENASINTILATFELNASNDTFDSNTLATAPDLPYKILNSTDYNNTFQLDQNGTHANLTLQKNNTNGGIDWEKKGTHTITVAAQNRWSQIDGNLHTGNEINITVSVNNVVETGPVLVCPNEPIEVHENTDQGQIVKFITTNYTIKDRYTKDTSVIEDFNMTADADFAIQKDATFYLEENASKPIDIGMLYISSDGAGQRGNLDYNESLADENNTINLLVSAWNNANNTQTYGNECNLTIQIIDDVDANVSLLVIPVNFINDINITDSPLYDVQNIKDKFFPFDSNSLNKYFKTVSKSKFYFTQALENVATPNDGFMPYDSNETYPPGVDETKTVLTHILNDLDIADINFTQFDMNKDSIVSSDELQVVFIFPEDVNYTIDDTRDYGSVSFEQNGTTINMNLLPIGIENNDKVNELFGIGFATRKLAQSTLGFTLGGLDGDQNYAYDIYGLMDVGYKGEVTISNSSPIRKEDSPVHPTIFNKMKQGWVTPTELPDGCIGSLNTDYQGGFSLNNIFYNDNDLLLYNANKGEASNAYMVPDNSTTNEILYYLIENRTTNKVISQNDKIFSYGLYDDSLQFLDNLYDEGGVLIWKVTNTGVFLENSSILNYTLNNTFTNDDFDLRILDAPDSDKTLKLFIKVK